MEGEGGEAHCCDGVRSDGVNVVAFGAELPPEGEEEGVGLVRTGGKRAEADLVGGVAAGAFRSHSCDV